MLKRRIIRDLTEWKSRKGHKSLVIQGARQVGKTFSVRQFAAENYSEILEINFKESPEAKAIFSGNLDVDTLLMSLRFRFPEKKITPEDTLIFLDEIQECPEAITSLKFWTDDGRFDVIASGSLLGIDYKRPSSYPVGYVDHIRMTGLDPEEFLWAMGVSEDMMLSLKELMDLHRPVPVAVHEQMMKYFRTYIAVGGMPEIVWEYVNSRDFRNVDRLQKALLQGYLYDIAHYATAEEKVKAEKCFLSLTRQLLDKENHKFQYKEIETGARAQKYYTSIDWLVRADIVNICPLVTEIKYDLADYAREDFFRLYTCDLSLLIAMKDFSFKQYITENTLTGNSKGGIYECAVADILAKKGYSLYFYKNETTRKELDFLIQRDGAVVPVEVKSGRERADSLNRIMEKDPDIALAYKFHDGNIGEPENGILSLPLYMAMFV